MTKRPGGKAERRSAGPDRIRPALRIEAMPAAPRRRAALSLPARLRFPALARLLTAGLAAAWAASSPAAGAEADDLRITPELYCEEFVRYETGVIGDLRQRDLQRRAEALQALPFDRLQSEDVPTLCFAARHLPGRLAGIATILQTRKQDVKGCTAVWDRLCQTGRSAILAGALRRLNQGFPPIPTCERLRDFFRSEAPLWGLQAVPSPLPCSGPYYNLAMALYNLRRLTYADHITDPSLQSFSGRVPRLYDEIVSRSLSVQLTPPDGAPAERSPPPECRTVSLAPKDLGPGSVERPATLPAIDPALVVADAIGERLVHEARHTYSADYPPDCGPRAEFLAGRVRNPDPGHVDCARGEQACDLALGSWWGGAYSWSVLWWNIVETFPGRLDTNEEIDKARRLHAKHRKYHCIQNCFRQIPSVDEIARALNRKPPEKPAAGMYLRVLPSATEVRAFDAPDGNWVWTLHGNFWSHVTAVREGWVETVVRDPESGEPSRAWVRMSEMELLP